MNESTLPASYEPPRANESAARILGVVLGVGVVCGLAIASVYEQTRPIIRENMTSQRYQAARDVLPDAREVVAFRFDPATGHFQPASSTDDSPTLYAGFDREGELVGMSIPAESMGYQDTIKLLYGYVPAAEQVIGIRVLQSRETPGLGDRIETDRKFLRTFQQLDVRLGPQEDALLNRIEFVRPGRKTKNWQIDGITGATISSRAVVNAIRESTGIWLPRIQARLHDFDLSKPPERTKSSSVRKELSKAKAFTDVWTDKGHKS